MENQLQMRKKRLRKAKRAPASGNESVIGVPATGQIKQLRMLVSTPSYTDTIQSSSITTFQEYVNTSSYHYNVHNRRIRRF